MARRSRPAPTTAATPRANPAEANDDADPLRLKSVSPRVYQAFYELYAALRFELHHYDAVFENLVLGPRREGDPVPSGPTTFTGPVVRRAAARRAASSGSALPGEDDPLFGRVLQRKKQVVTAAEIVNALRVALERGPEKSLDAPLRWARKFTGPFVPAPPKAKLKPAKDRFLEKVTCELERHAPAGTYKSRDEALRAAGRELSEQALEHPRGFGTPAGDGDFAPPKNSLAEFALFVAVALRDPGIHPVAALLPKTTIPDAAGAILQELARRNAATFEDPPLLAATCLRALGLDAEKAHSFFSYLSKEQKRRASDEEP